MALRGNKLINDYVILSGDIGGTNTRLSLFTLNAEQTKTSDDAEIMNHKSLFRKSYKNSPFLEFDLVLQQFFEDAAACLGKEVSEIVPEAACIAVAGPVSDNKVVMTNIQWMMDGDALARSFSIPRVRLVNDFLANGYGLLTLEDKDTHSLQDGKVEKNAPIACLGAGTGLGVVFLAPDENGRYEAFASEGGHVEFAPRSKLEQELQSFLIDKFNGRISVERVVSGKGIVNIYEFLRQKFPEQVNDVIDAEIMSSVNEAAAIISQHLHDNKLCHQSFELMYRAYASTTGNLALQYMPYGGLYITGGIILKSMEFAVGNDAEFMDSFKDKGRVSPILAKVPLKIVLAEDLGMRGAHVVANRELISLVQQDVAPSSTPTASGVAVRDNTQAAKDNMTLLIGAATLAYAAFIAFKLNKL